MFQPDSVSLDYEMAVIQAVQDVFPDAQLFGCLYHLVHNLKLHLSQLQLIGDYNTDVEFATTARMIVYIAFVQLDAVDDAFAAIRRHIRLVYPTMLPLIAWFETHYIGQ